MLGHEFHLLEEYASAFLRRYAPDVTHDRVVYAGAEVRSTDILFLSLILFACSRHPLCPYSPFFFKVFRTILVVACLVGRHCG